MKSVSLSKVSTMLIQYANTLAFLSLQLMAVKDALRVLTLPISRPDINLHIHLLMFNITNNNNTRCQKRLCIAQPISHSPNPLEK